MVDKGVSIAAVVAMGLATIAMPAGPAAAWDHEDNLLVPVEQIVLPHQRDSERLEGVSAGLYEDMRGYAATHGVSLFEVQSLFKGFEEFDQLRIGLEKDYPNHLVLSRWLHGEGEFWVHPSVMREVEARVGHFAARVVMSRLPAEVEMERLVRQAGELISEEFASGFAIAFDYEKESIIVDSPSISSTEILRSASAQIGLPITWRKTAAPEPTARGGYQYNPYNGCTGGYIVLKKNSAIYGILTAQHCDSTPSTYDSAPLGSTQALAGYDLRFTRFTDGSASATKKFRSGTNSHQTVTGAANPAVGSIVCKFGRITLSSCDIITVRNTCVTYAKPGGGSWPQWCGMMRTATNNVQGGDSGGPVFTNGATARGIVSGRSAGNYDIYSRISDISGFDVNLNT